MAGAAVTAAVDRFALNLFGMLTNVLKMGAQHVFHIVVLLYGKSSYRDNSMFYCLSEILARPKQVSLLPSNVHSVCICTNIHVHMYVYYSCSALELSVSLQFEFFSLYRLSIALPNANAT